MKWKSMPVFLFCTWTIGDPITCGLHLESVLGGNPWLLQIFKVKMLVLSICYSVSGGLSGPRGSRFPGCRSMKHSSSSSKTLLKGSWDSVTRVIN